MKKQVATVKLVIPAGKAAPGPKLAQNLGPQGVNMLEFCKQFNERTRPYAGDGLAVTAVISVFNDRSFTFVTRSPNTSALLKKAAGLPTEKGSGAHQPGKEVVGRINRRQLAEIARIKLADTNAATLEACMRMIQGSARSMGIEVVD